MGCGWRCCGRWLRFACALRCLSETAKVTTIAMRIHPMRAGASAVIARRLRTDQNSSGDVLAAEARDVPGIARDDPLDEPRSAELPVACGPGRRWHAPEAPEGTAAMNPGRRRTASSGGAPWFAGNARPADEHAADMNPRAVPRGAPAEPARAGRQNAGLPRARHQDKLAGQGTSWLAAALAARARAARHAPVCGRDRTAPANAKGRPPARSRPGGDGPGPRPAPGEGAARGRPRRSGRGEA